MNATEQRGHDLAKGACYFLTKLAIALVLLSAVIMLICAAFDVGIDDTDASGFHRSGLRLLRDPGTGMEYLSDGKGGLVRRF